MISWSGLNYHVPRPFHSGSQPSWLPMITALQKLPMDQLIREKDSSLVPPILVWLKLMLSITNAIDWTHLVPVLIQRLRMSSPRQTQLPIIKLLASYVIKLELQFPFIPLKPRPKISSSRLQKSAQLDSSRLSTMSSIRQIIFQ